MSKLRVLYEFFQIRPIEKILEEPIPADYIYVTEAIKENILKIEDLEKIADNYDFLLRIAKDLFRFSDQVKVVMLKAKNIEGVIFNGLDYCFIYDNVDKLIELVSLSLDPTAFLAKDRLLKIKELKERRVDFNKPGEIAKHLSALYGKDFINDWEAVNHNPKCSKKIFEDAPDILKIYGVAN